ncbi:ribonuclease H-like domain-containing protein [Tanacetum coccineum]
MSIHNSENSNDDVANSVTMISKLNISDPLHLHPNDTTALTVVSIKLKGTENYQVWSCSMILALEEKNKIGFIDGSCKRSNTDEVLGKQRDRINTLKQNDSYMQIRSSILSREVLPDVRSAYATISSEESHRVAISSVVGSSQGNQASAFVQGGGSGLNNNRQGGGFGLVFTDEQMATLISLIKDNKVRKNVQANMADSGANQHMTYTDKELDNVLDISHLKIKVGHPNGTEAYISKIGNLKLSNGLTPYDVMVIPEYCITLISVHKLVKENKHDWHCRLGYPAELVLNDSKVEKNDSANVFQDVNQINFFDIEYPEIPNDDERVANDLNKDKSDCSSSSVFGSNINTADFPVDSGNDANSNDGLVATQNEEVATLEENVFSKGNLDKNPSSSQGVQNVRRSSRQSVFLRNYNDFVVESKVKYGIEKYVGYSKLNFKNYCFITQLNKTREPKSYFEASKYPHWTDAMNQEMDALLRNGTWEMVHLPEGRKAIGSKWIDKIKFRSSGEIDRYKARLVAQGFRQKEGIDYEETFSSVVKMVTVRCLLNIVVSMSWPVFQLDVNNAFLYGDLEEAPSMIKGFLVLLVYVDDIIITGNNISEIEKFKVYLKSKFMIKDLGKLKYFLRIEVVDTDKGICLNRRKYVLDLLSEYSMLAWKHAKTPLMSKLVISNEASDKDPLLENITDYQKLMGKLIYLTNTRPYISYVVHCLSQFMHFLLTSHLKIAFKILRYLKSCPGLGIHITKTSGMFLNAYSDADWAKCIVTRKSVTGYCVFLNNSLVSWKSKKQNTLSKSSIKAEYRALASVTSEVIWILKFLKDLQSENLLPVSLHCDSNSAIKIAANPVFHERTKHLEIDLHFVREKILKGMVKTVKVDSANQIADILTKGLDTIQHFKLVKRLGMQDVYQGNVGSQRNCNHIIGSEMVSFIINMEDDVDINTLTIEQYLAWVQDDIRPGVLKPKISNDVEFEINSNFMRELRANFHKHLNDFGEKFADNTRVFEKIDSNPINDLKELLKTYDFENLTFGELWYRRIAANPVFHERTKHLEIDLHFVREKILKGMVKTVKVDSANQIADILTKGLDTIQHFKLVKRLGMQDVYQVETKGGESLIFGGKKKNRERAECVIEDTVMDLEDFSLCLLGKVKDFASLTNLKVVLIKEGYENLELKYMGGFSVMITFQDDETKYKFHTNLGVGSWFSQLIQAHSEFKIDERVIWVEIEGVPCKWWSRNTFSHIAARWGTMLNGEESATAGFHTNRICWVPDFEEDSDGESGDGDPEDEEPNNDILGGNDASKSGDPFGIYDIINKKREASTNDCTPEKSCKYPPGFTPDVKGDASVKGIDVVVQETQNKYDQEDGGSVEKNTNVRKETLSDAEESFCSSHFRKSIAPHTGGSIIQFIDDFVKVGQTMGYDMTGCIENMEKIIESQGVNEGYR